MNVQIQEDRLLCDHFLRAFITGGVVFRRAWDSDREESSSQLLRAGASGGGGRSALRSLLAGWARFAVVSIIQPALCPAAIGRPGRAWDV